MGLLLLIPGILLLVNGTEWFNGENAVGLALVVIGAILTLIQAVAFAAVASKVKREFDKPFPTLGGPTRVVGRERKPFNINEFRR